MSNTIRNTVLTLVALAAISVLARNFSGAATTTSTAPARHFYLTKTMHDGSHALGSCATGYHVASIWEIHEPALLTYNKSLGLNLADDGAGPPTFYFGWARTGWLAAPTNIPGQGNCDAWTSNASGDSGTIFFLSSPSYSSAPTDPWTEDLNACSVPANVWCVEN